MGIYLQVLGGITLAVGAAAFLYAAFFWLKDRYHAPTSYKIRMLAEDSGVHQHGKLFVGPALWNRSWGIVRLRRDTCSVECRRWHMRNGSSFYTEVVMPKRKRERDEAPVAEG